MDSKSNNGRGIPKPREAMRSPKVTPKAHEAAPQDDFDLAVLVEEFTEVQTKPLDGAELSLLLAKCREGLTDVDEPLPEGAAPAAPAVHTHRKAAGMGLPSVVAIDFGTSYSSAAFVVGDDSHLIPVGDRGERVLPSVVGINEEGYAVVGDAARQMSLVQPDAVIHSPKRLLGRRFDDREVEPHLMQMPMLASPAANGEVELRAQGRTYSVSQLCAPILYRIRLAIAKHLGHEITDVVLTSPVSFDARQRRALSEAATLAGLRVRRFLDEPTAAILANRPNLGRGHLAAVYDFGGGTFDFSLVAVGANASLSVIGNAGDTWLGGDDFDQALANAAANAFWREAGVELRHQVVQWQRLLLQAERVKRVLSIKREAMLHLSEAALSESGPLDLQMSVSRKQFADLSHDLIQRTMDTCSTALELSGVAFSDLTAVFMSGGTSFIPAVLDAVSRSFGRIPLMTVPPDLAVVLGAADYAMRLEATPS